MASLPSEASLTGASTTNAQQKANFASLRGFLADLLGIDSANKAAARAALGAIGLLDITGNQSLATPGFVRIPGGLILQWGYSSTAGSTGQQTVTYPASFPNACFSIQITPNDSGASYANTPQSLGAALGGFVARVFDPSGAPVSASKGFFWFALGS